jgi:Flp pilus assembly protein TadG
MSIRTPYHRSLRRGVASVELAMLLPILSLLLFGTVEVGNMFSAYLRLHNMAREGARCAALGDPPSEVTSRSLAAGTLPADSLSSECEYRVWTEGSGWGDWVSLGSDGSANNAPSGAQVRVQLTYDYHLVVGRLFRSLADDPESGVKELMCQVVMCRE